MIKYPQQSYSTRVCSIALSARSAQIPSNPSTFTRTNVIFHRENWGYSNVIFCLFLMDFQPFPPWRFSSKWCNSVKKNSFFSVSSNFPFDDNIDKSEWNQSENYWLSQINKSEAFYRGSLKIFLETGQALATISTNFATRNFQVTTSVPALIMILRIQVL